MFESNLKAKVQVNKAVIIGFLLALGDLKDKAVEEFLTLIEASVWQGLGPLPKLPEEVIPEGMNRPDAYRAWNRSFLTLEHWGPEPEKLDLEGCLRVVNPDGSMNYALTELARLTVTVALKGALEQQATLTLARRQRA